MKSDTSKSIKLYHYAASPYARKVLWYLALRGIPYTEVKQPMVMPRPDLKAIGVAYRRIPVLAIGKDVYCDTRMILDKLEEQFPEGKIGATTPDAKALQKLLQIWHIEGPVFWRGVSSMPSNGKMFADPSFQKDREQMTGRPWNIEAMKKQRPESLAYMQSVFRILESLLVDGREWILSTKTPSLGDIEAVFVVHWLWSVKIALPKDLISADHFPKTFGWIQRFDTAVTAARKASPQPRKLDGVSAAREILSSDYVETQGQIDPAEPQRLQKSDHVELFPTDSGYNNKDRGKLLSMTDSEIVIELDNGVRLHTPRVGFRVVSTQAKL